MDVVVVTSLYPPHSYGGYEASCRDVVDRWRARGHGVTVLTSDWRVAGVADDPAEQGVRRELRFYWDDHRLPERTWRETVEIEQANRVALHRLLDEQRPDVVSAWSMGALSLGLLTEVVNQGLPLVAVVCDDWLVYGERADLWRRRQRAGGLRARLAARVTDLPVDWPPAERVHGVYVSEAVRRRAREAARWRPATDTVVGSGIDPRDFPPAEATADREWSGRVLCVGRIDPRKGVGDAITALAALPAATLDVVGRGDAEHLAELQRQAVALGVTDRVRWQGAVERSELAAVYRAADVLLFPPTWDEPFGLVPLEAMACGTPVVATGTGGSADFLVDGDNCLLVPPGDPAALAAAVQRLAEDPGLRRRLVAGGLATAAEHDVDRYAERLEAEHLRAVPG